MIFVGFIALLQMAVLPGLVFLKLLRFSPKSWTQGAVYTFAASLCINSIIIHALYWSYAYHQRALAAIIVLELLYLFVVGARLDVTCTWPWKVFAESGADAGITLGAAAQIAVLSIVALAVWLKYTRLTAVLVMSAAVQVLFWTLWHTRHFRRFRAALPKLAASNRAFPPAPRPHWTTVCSLWLATCSVLVAAWLCVRYFGSVFVGWDDVLSWDRWAMEWYRHSLTDTAYYPQLIPANWSIAYMLLDTTQVKMFHKALMPLFTLGMVLIPLELCSLRGFSRTVAGFVSALTLLALQFVFDDGFLASGYVETASAFFAIAAFYAWCEYMEPPSLVRGIVFPAMFAAGTLMTKQGGIYFLAVFLVALIAHTTLMPRKHFPARRFVVAIMCVALVALPMAKTQYENLSGQRHGSNVAELTGKLHDGRTYPQRWTFAFHELTWRRGATYAAFPAGMIVLIAVSLASPAGRWVTLTFVLPFYTLWAFLFSYELRTLAMSIPFAALSAGLGLEVLLLSGGRLRQRCLAALRRVSRVRRRLILGGSAGAAFLVLLVLTIPMRDDVVAGPLTRAVRDMFYGYWFTEVGSTWLWSAVITSALALRVARTGTVLRVRVQLGVFLTFLTVSYGILRASGFSDDLLVRQQLVAQRAMCWTSVNDKLYAYAEKAGFKGEVANEYYHFAYLPEVGRLSYYKVFPAGFSYDWLHSMLLERPRVRHLLFAASKLSGNVRTLLLQKGYTVDFADPITGFCLISVPPAP